MRLRSQDVLRLAVNTINLESSCSLRNMEDTNLMVVLGVMSSIPSTPAARASRT